MSLLGEGFEAKGGVIGSGVTGGVGGVGGGGDDRAAHLRAVCEVTARMMTLSDECRRQVLELLRLKRTNTELREASFIFYINIFVLNFFVQYFVGIVNL